MNPSRFSEQQLRTRGRIGTITTAFALTLVLLLTTAMELTGEWMTPHALGMTVLCLTLGLQTILAILWDAYTPQPVNVKNHMVAAIFVAVVVVIQAVFVVRMIGTGRFLEDGRLGAVWVSLVMLVACSGVLCAGAWKHAQKN